MQIKLIFSTKVFLLASFWKWELFELGKGLIGPFRVPPGLCMKTRWSTQPFIWKWFFILMQIKLIFIRKVVHLASFWKWGFLELGSGLLRLGDKRDEELTWVKKKLPEFNFDTPRTIYPFLVLQANAIKEDVGYPSFIKDDSKLDALYSMVSKNCFILDWVSRLKMWIYSSFVYIYGNT